MLKFWNSVQNSQLTNNLDVISDNQNIRATKIFRDYQVQFIHTDEKTETNQSKLVFNTVQTGGKSEEAPSFRAMSTWHSASCYTELSMKLSSFTEKTPEHNALQPAGKLYHEVCHGRLRTFG